MSGPIIRKYGFPNFEKIFGARAPQHGVDEEQTPAAEKTPAEPAAATDPDPRPTAPADETTAARKGS